jgi:hypothetical protein
MKLPILAAALLAGAALAHAQVPGLINYQGRLTTPSGAPASGTRNFSLSIFDAETGGTLLYTEAVGPVTLDATGVYSFHFGSAGTSNTQVMETLATTDGTASSFQKILANTGVVAGSLSITDGTYTWSQSAGSSNEDDFGVAYSSSLRRVTVSYFSAPPAAGKPITATYRYGTNGIAGAISAGSQHWMALSIDGVVQAERQRVLAVPFAMQAGFAAMAGDVVRKSKTWRPSVLLVNKIIPNVWPTTSILTPTTLPIYAQGYMSSPSFDLESKAKALIGFQARIGFFGSSDNTKITIRINKISAETGYQNIFTEEFKATQGSTTLETKSFSRKLEIDLDSRFMYRVGIDIPANTGSAWANLEDIVFSIIE